MDSLTHGLQSLALEAAPKLVYMDVLNFAMYFFKFRDHWSFRQAKLKVHKLVASANASNIRLKVFIDAFIQSKTSIDKWRKRRENEVRKCIRNVPQGLNVLLGEMFAAEGVEVCYSVDADNDDTLASHAHHDNACVLSQDKDFLSYVGATYTIYTEFSIKKGLLILTERTDMVPKPHVPMLDIKEKPATRNCNPGVTSLPTSYLRGSPSPLTRQCGNLHLIIRPLRQAYYASLGLKAAVHEEFPVFNEISKCVEWDVENVKPDDFLIELLGKPVLAHAYFFKTLKKPRDVSYENWSNHIYATYSVVFEMCGLYLNESLLSLLQKHAVKP